MRFNSLFPTLMACLALSSCLDLPAIAEDTPAIYESETDTTNDFYTESTQTDTQLNTDTQTDPIIDESIDAIEPTDTHLVIKQDIPDFYVDSVLHLTETSVAVSTELNFYADLSINGNIDIEYNKIQIDDDFSKSDNYEYITPLEEDSHLSYSYNVTRGELTHSLLLEYPELENETFSYEWTYNNRVISNSQSITNPAPEKNKTDVDYIVTDQFGETITGTHTFYNEYNQALGLDVHLQKDFMYVESIVEFENLDTNNYVFTWQTGDGYTYLTPTFEHHYAEKGIYYLTLIVNHLITNETVKLDFVLDYSVKTGISIEPKVETSLLDITLMIPVTGHADEYKNTFNVEYVIDFSSLDLNAICELNDLNCLSTQLPTHTETDYIISPPSMYFPVICDFNDSECDDQAPEKRFVYEINYGDHSEVLTGETDLLQFNYRYAQFGEYIITVSIYDRVTKHSAVEQYIVEIK